MPGFERGRKLDKIGMRAQDTSNCFFHDRPVVPAGELRSARKGAGSWR